MNYAQSFSDIPYDFDFSGYEQQLEEILPTLVQAGLVLAVVAGIFLLLFYMLLSISVYTMAERRGIGGAFCAWIPVVRWIVVGHVASDIYHARTGKRAFYGSFIALTIIIQLAEIIGSLIYDVPAWIVSLTAVFVWLYRVLRIFSLAEIYRDYAKHWVGLLIFNVMFFWLTPIFMIAVHKHIPESVRRSYSAEHHHDVPRVEEKHASDSEAQAPAEPEPIVTPAPQEETPKPELTLDGETPADSPADTGKEADHTDGN